MTSGTREGLRALSIGAASEVSGVNIETIRYYERIGVMPAPGRSAGNQRLYGAEAVKRLRFVRRCRELGFSLDDIRVLLGLADGGGNTCAGVRSITVAHAAGIRRKIADLRRMERVLQRMAACCDGGDMPDCPIIDALSA